MSPELEDATRAALLLNLTLVLKRGNRRRTASGLLAYVQPLLADDPHGRIAIAQVMREIIAELERSPCAGIETQSSVVQFARR